MTEQKMTPDEMVKWCDCSIYCSELLWGTTTELKQIRDYIAATKDRPAQEWQPIETAPRDGSFVLGWCDRWDTPIQVRFLTGIGRWTTLFQPTHWMPLPKPPEKSRKVSDDQTENDAGEDDRGTRCTHSKIQDPQ